MKKYLLGGLLIVAMGIALAINMMAAKGMIGAGSYNDSVSGASAKSE